MGREHVDAAMRILQIQLASKSIDAITKADIAREVQAAIVDVLAAKAMAALAATGRTRLVVAGGVGANRDLRKRLVRDATARGARVHFPELAFCTDNGAMIALVGALRLAAGEHGESAFTVKPRWELASLSAPATSPGS